MTYAIGVDIGGTKIAAGVVSSTGECLYVHELPSITTDREQLFAQVVRCIEELMTQAQLSLQDMTGIGLGVPGIVDVIGGRAVRQNNVPWSDFPVVDRIASYFDMTHVVMDNDVYMAGYAEWRLSVSQPLTFVYMTISTGISCSPIINGHMIHGAGFAGEVGFLPVAEAEDNDEGHTLEDLASGPGIVAMARKQLREQQEGQVYSLTTADVIADFKRGDRYAEQTMHNVFQYIAHGIYSVFCVLDPERFVIGGGVMNHHPDLLEHIQTYLRLLLPSDRKDVLGRMQVNQLHRNAGVIGAGLKAIHHK